MVFSSLTFIFAFLPLVLLAYYLSPRFLRNLILLGASLVFYGWGEPVYISIMIFSTVFDYVNGLLIEKYRDKKGISTGVLINSMVINLGILCFFKYSGFAVENINRLFNLSLTSPNLPLPIGISFYTFQTMSYTIDAYLGKVPVQRNIISFGAYVTMFPQLVAGPIVRYSEVVKDIDDRCESLSLFGEGAERFLQGLGKKVLLANNIGLLWSSIKSTPIQEISILTAWLGIIAFTFQIYFDFSGYSDMAIGLGKMFGFNFIENFNYPYISKSVTEFWRRWHMSLGTWFREYVYIPLGGNRCGSLMQLRNLFVVWFLTGLWHGASWNFILWGVYYGAFIAIEKMFLLKHLNKLPNFVGHVYTLIVVIVGWVLFEFDNLGACFSYIGRMFGFGDNVLYDSNFIYYLYTNALLLVILSVFSTPLIKNAISGVKSRIKLTGALVMPVLYLVILVLSTAFLVNDTYNPFLYFRF